MAQASPADDLKKAKAKLEKLDTEVDKLVDKYNKRNETAKEAKAKLQKVAKKLAKEETRVRSMRSGIAALANSTYQGAGGMGTPGIIAAKSPEEILRQLSAAGFVAEGQAQAVSSYVAALAALRGQQAEAKKASEKASAAAKAVKADKVTVEKKIKEQLKLIRKLGGDMDSPNPGSGKKYDGPASGDVKKVLDFAYAQIGDPYRYGGSGPDAWDCSGLTQAAWAKAGVSLPHNASGQYSWGKQRNRVVSWGSMKPGDLIISQSGGHVGMYAGNGKGVHAPRTGKNVEEVPVEHFRSGLVGVVRP